MMMSNQHINTQQPSLKIQCLLKKLDAKNQNILNEKADKWNFDFRNGLPQDYEGYQLAQNGRQNFSENIIDWELKKTTSRSPRIQKERESQENTLVNLEKTASNLPSSKQICDDSCEQRVYADEGQAVRFLG